MLNVLGSNTSLPLLLIPDSGLNNSIVLVSVASVKNEKKVASEKMAFFKNCMIFGPWKIK